MKIITIILALMFLVSPIYANTYLLVDSETDEIISMSPEDDAQLEEGQKKIIIKDSYYDIELTASPEDYYYKDDKFIKNYNKISEKENGKILGEQAKEKLDADTATAKTKLIGLGFTEDEADAILK